MLEVKLSKFCVAIKFACPCHPGAGVQLKKKRVDTTDEAIGFRRSPITLTGLRAIAADARLAVNPDQIRPASLLDTIAGAPRLLQLLQSRSAVPAGRRLRRRWIWQNHAVGAMASADGRPWRTYCPAEPR